MNREVIQGTLMRSTIRMVSPADYPILLAGVQSSRREWWQRVVPKEARCLDMGQVAAVVRERLARGPARAAELKEATEAEGIELLVRRYLGGFGPGRVVDIASRAGLPLAKVQPVVQRKRLRRFLDESGRDLFDLPRAPLPPADSHAPVRFLQTFEALTMIHARRTGVMPEQYRPIIFSTKAPQSSPFFLIDGAVAGTWRYEGGRIRVDPFEPIPRAARPELDDEAAALAAFHVDSPADD